MPETVIGAFNNWTWGLIGSSEVILLTDSWISIAETVIGWNLDMFDLLPISFVVQDCLGISSLFQNFILSY